MASTYSALKIELIATGEQSGTWGATTNVNLGDAALGEAITGSADVAFSSADVTITLTDTNTTQSARNLRLNLTGTSGGARNLILGSGCQIEKLYLVNNGLADAVTVKNTTGTGIAVAAGKSMFVYNNGTNVVEAVNYAASISTGAITATSITNSGLTSGRVVYSTTGGLETDSANLTFNGTTLTANTIGAYTLGGTIAGGGNQLNNIIIGTSTPLAGSFTTINASTSITNAGLTSGRVTYAGASGLLSDSANLTWDGSTFGVTGAGTFSTGLTRTHAQGTDAYITNTTTGKANTVVAFNDSGSTNAQGVPTGYAYYGTLQVYPVAITTSGILAATFSTSGNLGLGVTPSAWSVGKAMEFGNVGNAVWGVSATQITMPQNAYFNGAWRYGANGLATRYAQEAGVHQWWNAPSGTAGNAVTFTQAMTLSAAGGLSIGLTADAGAGNILLTGSSGTIFGGATTGSRSYIELYNTSTGDMSLATTFSTANIKFLTGGTTTPTERMRIDSAGRIGFGTGGTVADRLINAGFTSVTTTGASQFGFVLNPTYPNTATANIYHTYFYPNITAGATLTNLYNLYLEANNITGSTVANSYGVYQAGSNDKNYFAGNVGIGTTSPSTYGKLVSLNTTGGAYAIAAVGNDQSNVRIRIRNTNGADFTIVGGTPGISNAGLAIFDETNSATRMLITSGGNVGINETNPPYQLTVAGTGYFQGPASDTAGLAGVFINYGNAAGIIKRFLCLNGNGVTNAALGLNQIDASNGDLVISTLGSGTLTEKMRLDSSGNLLVGTTSTAGVTTNTAQVTGGIFTTVTGSVTAASSTATTIFTAATVTIGCYIVTIGLAGSGVVYNTVGLVVTDASASRVTILSQGALSNITSSGLTIQATQTSGISQTIFFTATRVS